MPFEGDLGTALQDEEPFTFREWARILPVPTILLNANFTVNTVNPACKSLGSQLAKLRGLPFSNLFPDPSESSLVQNMLEHIISDGKIRTCKAHLRIADREMRVDLTGRRFSQKKRNFVLLVIDSLASEKEHARKVVKKAIEEREKAERALAESQTRFEQFVAHVSDIIVTTDIKGCFTFVNPPGLKLIGCTAEELLGTRFFDLVHPAYRKRAEKFYSTQFAKRKATTYYEVPVIDRSGKIMWLGQNVQLLFETDRIIGFKAISRNITDRRLAEDELKKSQRRYKDLFENANDVIYTHDLKGNYLSVNDAITRILGYEREEFLKSRYQDFIAPSSLPLVRENLRLKVEQGIQCTGPYEILVRSKSGKPVWMEITSRLMLKEGKPIGIHGIARDVTDRRLVQDRLNESQELYSIVTEQTGQLIYEYDPATGKVKWSGAIEATTGYTIQELVSDTRGWRKLIHPEDRFEAVAAFERAVARGVSFQIDYRFKRKDGTYIWIEDKGLCQKDESGSVFRVLGIMKDISGRKHVETALDLERKKFQILVDNAPFALMMLSQSNDLAYVNPKFKELFGYDLQEVPNGREWLRKAFPESAYRKQVIASWMQDMRKGATGEQRPRTFKVRCKDGTDKLIHFIPVQLSTGDQIVSCEDITYRIQGEKALQERERFLASVFSCIQDGLSIMDKDLRIIRTNATMQKWYKHDEPLIGKKCHEAYQGIDEVCPSCPALQTLKTGQATSFVIPKGGPANSITGWLDVCTFPLVVESSGEIEGVIVHLRDVTERRHLEEQLRQASKMEAIGTLAGGLAHDFNNLLQIVLGYADLLLLGKNKAESDYQRILAIRTAAKRGSDVVQRILTFSRKVETKLRPVNLNQELRFMEDLLRSTMPKNIAVKLQLAENPVMIQADPTQIEQIVLNLAVNAKQAMPKGGNFVLETRTVDLDRDYCRTRPETKPGKYVMLMVSDTGKGMDKDVLDRVFEPFFTTKQPGEGTGLGLSIVFGIVKSHLGHITCSSEPEVGTVFKLYFPLLKEQFESFAETTQQMPAFGSETLLMIDDEESIRNLGKELLNEAGYNVLTAGSGQEALRIYREIWEGVSLVILDLVMPDMSGLECLEELLKVNPDVKVLIASGYSPANQGREILELGAVGFVSKPYNFKQILAAVRAALDYRHK
ncbi:PAS domain S-box protein [Desulfomonile tiedjei]|uniref:histidine kinase n=1 Tax=Desulfomonile tiedjei (strain ATCC 49306 / DSM 6799 / DCB-1) TaxID=706587 RepID=I4CCX6_DESTA|nr:PAS domain S-box protein [Desulfomonile tiedjei]AFM27417.1 PAS domain S-box [Desulfomonile tiedjei DSM 6799]